MPTNSKIEDFCAAVEKVYWDKHIKPLTDIIQNIENVLIVIVDQYDISINPRGQRATG